MRIGPKPLATMVACMVAFAGAARGDTLTLFSQSAGQYNYAVQLDPNHGLVFTAGDQIILSGLSDVTGAALLPGLAPFFGNPVTSPTFVTITNINTIVFDPVAGGVTIPAFCITSSVQTTGLVGYQIQTENEGTLSGTTQGPRAVPEPGGLIGAVIGVTFLLSVLRCLRPSNATRHLAQGI